MNDHDEPAVIHPPEWIGNVDVTSDVLMIGDLEVTGVGSGYPRAGVYVQRISGKHRFGEDGKIETVPGFPIAEIHISIVGDYWAQAELDAQNEEAQRHPLGPEAYWAARGFPVEELYEDDDE